MKLKSMKNVEKESEPKAIGDKQEYPYGLHIYLDEDVLKKLEMETLPQIGDQMMLHARIEVTSLSMSHHKEEKTRSLGIQITEMDLVGEASEKSAEQVIYGEE